MPLLMGSTQTVRIALPTEGEWVEVKRALSRADEREIQRRVLSAARVDVAAAGAVELDAGLAYDAAEFATLEIAIQRWSFAEQITPRALRCLDDASLAAIKDELNRLYPGPLPEAEKNGSSGSGATPS